MQYIGIKKLYTFSKPQSKQKFRQAQNTNIQITIIPYKTRVG